MDYFWKKQVKLLLFNTDKAAESKQVKQDVSRTVIPPLTK